MIKVFLVEDHDIVRDGIKSILTDTPGISVIGEASNGNELLKQISPETDIVIMDIHMPLLDGVETTKLLSLQNKNVKILILSMLDHENYITELFNAGVKGYMLKSTGKDELIYAIKRIHNSGMYISPEIMAKSIDRFILLPRDNSNKTNIALSKRELEVLRLLSEGLTNNEIAEKLYTSRRTIETHRKNLIDKTSSKNTAALIRYAIMEGIIN